MTTIHNDNLRVATESVRLSGLPGSYSNFDFEAADDAPPRLSAGVVVAFAIAAVVAVLGFIEIITS
jgi:hypothetical protein